MLYGQRDIHHNTKEQTNSGVNQQKVYHHGGVFNDTLMNYKALRILTENTSGFIGNSDLRQNNTPASTTIGTVGTTAQGYCGTRCVKKGILKLHLHNGGAAQTILTPSTNNWEYNNVTFSITPSVSCSSLVAGNISFSINPTQPEQVYYLEIPAECLRKVNGTCPNNNPSGITSVTITEVTNPDKNTLPSEVDLRLDASFTLVYEQSIGNEYPVFLNLDYKYTNCQATTTLSRTSGSTVKFYWDFPTSTIYCPDELPSYQIQLLRLYNEDPLKTTDEMSITSTIDWNKALTFETERARSQNSSQDVEKEITLTIAEGRGYYVWRVRPIYDIYEGGINNPLNYGNWSASVAQGQTISLEECTNFSTVSPDNRYAVFFYDGFDNDRNWVYTRGFVEGDKDGVKIGEGITYTNDLLEPVQSQVRNMTDGTTIVSHGVNDLSGRPLVSVLPTPVNQNYLGYISNFLASTPYTPYTIDGGTHYTQSQTMDGAPSTYYSSNAGTQIPESEDIPFGKYNVNREGKVAAVGGIGPQRRIDNTNKTFINYGGVADKEIVSIFGKEAPRISAVSKTIVKDVNGVESVQYSDAAGRVIATCLIAGQSEIGNKNNDNIITSDDVGATLLNPLDEKINILATQHIITAEDNTIYSDSKLSISQKKISVSKQQDVQFIYDEIVDVPKVKPLKNETATCEGEFCKNCDYSIVFRITDASTGTVVYTLGNVDALGTTPTPITNLSKLNCTITPQFSGLTFTVNLPIGEYYVERMVIANNFQNQSGTIVTTEDSYVNEALQGIKPLNDILTSLFATTPVVIPLEIPFTPADQYYSKSFIQYRNYYKTYKADADKKISINVNPTTCRIIDLPPVSCPLPCEDDNGAAKNPGLLAYLVEKLSQVKRDPTQELNQLNSLTPNSGDLSDNRYFFVDEKGVNKTGTQFLLDVMVQNMINCGYSCMDLYAAWQGVVAQYITLLESNIQEESSQSPSTYRPNTGYERYWAYNKVVINNDNPTPRKVYYDIIEEFLNIVNKYNCTVLSNQIQLSSLFVTEFQENSFKEIVNPSGYYTTNDINLCKNTWGTLLQSNGTTIKIDADNSGTVSSTEAANFTEAFNSFYGCLKGRKLLDDVDFMARAREEIGMLSDLENPCQDFKEDNLECRKRFLEKMTEQCQDKCWERRDEFIDLYKKMMTDNNQTFNDDDVECAVAMLIQDCEKGCTLTMLPNGTVSQSEMDRYKESMTGKVSLSFVPQNIPPNSPPPCPVGYRSLGNANDYRYGILKSLVEHLNNEYTTITKSISSNGCYGPYVVTNFAIIACNFLASKGITPCPPCIASSPYLQNLRVYPCSEAYFELDMDHLPKKGAYSSTACGECAITFRHEDVCELNDYPNSLNDWLNATTRIETSTDNQNVTYDINDNFDVQYLQGLFPGNTYSRRYYAGFVPSYNSAQSLDAEIAGIVKNVRLQSTFWRPSYLTLHRGYLEDDYCNYLFYGNSNMKLVYNINSLYPSNADGGYAYEQPRFGIDLSTSDGRAYDYQYLPLLDEHKLFAYGYNLQPNLNNPTPSKWLTFGAQFVRFPYYTNKISYTSQHFVTGIYPLFDHSEFAGIRVYLRYENSMPQGPKKYRDNVDVNGFGGYDVPLFFEDPDHLQKINSIFDYNYQTAIGRFYLDQNGYLMFEDKIRNNTHRFTRTRFGSMILDKIICEPSFCEPYVSCTRFCVKYEVDPPIPIANHSIEFRKENCYTNAVKSLKEDITRRYNALIAQMKDEVRKEYRAKCAANKFGNDKLTVNYTDNFYHYTLYYYDAAGRLIKTVPPKGVKIDQSYTRSSTPNHEYVSTFEYNSAGQIIKETVPDGGVTNYSYNDKGLLRASQNARQAAAGRATVYNYDSRQRIKETVEIDHAAVTTAYYLTHYTDISSTGLNPKDRSAITYTSTNTLPAPYGSINQNNTRAKISKVSYDNGSDGGDDIAITYYSYDKHNNVEWVIHKNPGLEGIKIDYSYELISGNMKRVSYRKGYADQLFTHYSYDRDNRLVNVQTSLDTVIWDTDIAYEYYAHGPIKRTILGEDKIQGTDYAYTIHGWLKSINHPNTAYDPGNDGAGTTNTTVGKDVFGLTLNYYSNDYTGYGNKYSTDTKAPAHNLYDGNISSMSYRLTKSGAANNDYFMMDLNADDYRYDKLGRLREDIFYNRDNNTTYNTKSYDSYYKYDPNGNIRSLMRNSLYFNTNTNAVDQKQIDNLTYHYGAVPGAITNTLNHVTDAVAGATNGVNDLVTQPLNTYEYDESGNLKRDNELSVDYIWNSSGKIYEIKRTTGANQFTIRFDYDAQGHKIRKQTLNGSGIVQNTTYYVYDGGGTLMSVYTKTGENGAVYQKEAPINAPGRIGMWKFGNAERMHGNTALGSIQLYSRQINKKLYEITDQTGNVRVVLSDNKSVISGAVVPKVIMSSNYYPYGMAQAGRVISEGEDYRYGYNGMEEEDRGQEVSTEIASTGDKAKPGEGNLLNTEYRLYDPRLAQWLTRDPIFQPWESPYVSMGGNPIQKGDPLGLEATTETCVDEQGNEFMMVNYKPESGKNWTDAVYLGQNEERTETYFFMGSGQYNKAASEPVGVYGDGYTRKEALFYPLSTISHDIAGTGVVDMNFSWHVMELENSNNDAFNGENERALAGFAFAEYVAKRHIKGNPILVIGFSHGNNGFYQGVLILDGLLKHKYGNDYKPKYEVFSLNAPGVSRTYGEIDMYAAENDYRTDEEKRELTTKKYDIENPCYVLTELSIDLQIHHFYAPFDGTVFASSIRTAGATSAHYYGDITNDPHFEQFRIGTNGDSEVFWPGHPWFFFKNIFDYNWGRYKGKKGIK